MTQFVVNSYRFDPYKNMRFRVKWDGRYVAGVSKVSALKRSIEVATHRDGGFVGAPTQSPTVAKFEPITLERGVTHDPEFENWANNVYDVEGGAVLTLKNFRKDIIVELLNEQGVVAKAYKVFRCWVSEYQALPELDANGHAVAFEHIVLQNEGWVRDVDVTEPVQT
ncbi:MAG TPA: phage tail protein [Burkholderiaceae bacterium]